MPGARPVDLAVEPRERRDTLRVELTAMRDRLNYLLGDLDPDEGQPDHPAARARSCDDEMVSVGWAAQYIKVSKDRLKDLAKEHAFGWLVGGRIKIHKRRFLAYILTHQPPASRS